MKVIRKWDLANKETHDKCLDEIITRVEEIGDDSIGVIAAQDIIDIVTEAFAPAIYNKAILDAKRLLEDRMGDIETEIDLLQVQA